MTPFSNSSPYSVSLKAVILAAGASTRLHPLTETIPKCLLRIGKNTLLEQTIENILDAGIKEIAIVIGYKGEMIREFVRQRFPHELIRFILNPNFAETNNAYSLLLARRFLENKEGKVSAGLLLLDSDILFSKRLLPFFLKQPIQGFPGPAVMVPAQGLFAVRVSGVHDEEEIHVKVEGNNIIQMIGKHVALLETYGESIGIELFSSESTAHLFAILEQRVRSGIGRTEFYEASFQEMIMKGIKLQAVDVSMFPSIEIDTVEDFYRAEQMRPS